MKRRAFAWLERVVASLLFLWVMAGVWLRVSRVRDGIDPLALVFYTTPWLVIGGALGALAGYAALRKRGRAARWYTVAAAGAACAWAGFAWHGPPAAAVRADLRVAEWNVNRPGPWNLPHVSAWLRAQDADLIAVAEADPREKIAPWEAAFPEYRAVRSGGEMLCLVRGEVLEHTAGMLAYGSYYGLMRVRVRGVDLTVVQADIWARPISSRREPLGKLAEMIRSHAGERVIALGDFNTPRDSVHFDQFRPALTHAFEAAGSGLGETWPMPLPSLSLDHVWCNSGLRPLACRIGWPIWSDHRPVVVDFAVSR